MANAKKIEAPACQEPAAKVIQQVLLARLKKMCALRERALTWGKPEGVHAMRVASRRLRSALSDFKPYLRKDSIPSHRLKPVAKSLGAVRDEDVVLAALEKLLANVDDKVATGIKLIVEDHRRHRRRARAVLEPAITADAIAALRADFRSRIRTAVRIPAPPGAEDESQVFTFRQLGTKVIGNRLKRLTKAAESIYRPLETKKLHELRILTKRLRYAVELFEACWGDEFNKFAEEIARLQTSLGELHDCDVWIENLGDRLQRDRKQKRGAGHDGSVNNETVVWLLHYFAGERTTHYCQALARWHKWESDGFLDRLNTMLNLEPAPVVERPKGRTKSTTKSTNSRANRGKPKAPLTPSEPVD